MKLLALFIVLTLLILAESQQLIDLKSLQTGTTQIKSATSPYSIYVSASSDSDDILKQINVVSNQTISLSALKNNMYYQNLLLLEPFVIDGVANVTTSLSNSQLQNLTGFLYVTTAKQLADPSFFVYNVKGSQNIHQGNFPASARTTVFLNSNFESSPYQTSVISGWSQTSGHPVSIYESIPKDEAVKNNSFIFSNPVLTTSGRIQITNVETFSLSLGAFYILSESGLDFTIKAGYENIDNSKTTSTTTTGLYMKSYTSPDSTVTIQTSRNSNGTGIVGVNVVGSVPAAANITFSENDGSSYSAGSVSPVDQILGWSTDHVGQNLTIKSTGAVAGEFFVQYYVISSETPTSTSVTVPQTTTSKIQTTTSSSTIAHWIISAIIPLIGARLL